MRHKFENGRAANWPNGYYAQNTILRSDTFEPEVIFIGTFNPTVDWNVADIYYGRGKYMWTIMYNLFVQNHNHREVERTPNDEEINLQTIFGIIERGKISFADIIGGVNPDVPIAVDINNRTVIVNEEHDITDFSDRQLDNVGAHGLMDDNVDEIVKFINETTSIKHVYFTFKSGNWIVNRKNDIINGIERPINCCSIISPSSNGFGKALPIPFNTKPSGIAHTWIWNEVNHPAVPVNRDGYEHLDHDWLISKGVNPENF